MASQLYAALGGPNTTSNLYSVDPATGNMTSIGPIGFAVTGLAIDPTTGILYGATSNNSASHPKAIITIDRTTGAGTLVADLSLTRAAADIAFSASGQLYGWDSTGGGLWAINKSTGVVTTIGAVASDYSGGLDFSGGTLYHVIGNDQFVETVNLSTGAVTTVATGSDTTRLQAGKFNPDTGVFWGTQTGNNHLVTVDISSGAVSVQASLTIGGVAQNNVDAIAWGPAPGPFSVSCSPNAMTFAAGSASSQSTTVTSALGTDTSGTVLLSVSGLPAGMTAAFVPTSINENAGTSTLTITTTSTVAAGTYALTVTGNNGSASETTTLTVTVSKNKTVLATADPNTSSPTVTITGTGVIDSRIWQADTSPNFYGIDDLNLYPSPSFYVRGTNLPSPGAYKVVVNGVATDVSPTTERFAASYALIMHVNGHLFGMAPFVLEVDSNAGYGVSGSFAAVLTGPPASGITAWLGGPPYYGLKAGDEVSFSVVNDGRDDADTTLEVRSVDFVWLADGGPQGTIDLATVSNLPLGATAWTDAGLTPARIADDAYPNCKDLCVTSNGDVYVVSGSFVSASPAWNATGKMVLWRWNGAAWSEISSTFAGNTRGKPSCSIGTDGTNVFIAWGEVSTTQPPVSRANRNSEYQTAWRCMKYSPGSGTFTELGSSTGQANKMPAVRTQSNCDAGRGDCAVTLRVDPSGSPWVGWCETDDAGATPFFTAPLIDDLTNLSASWDQSGLTVRSTTILYQDSSTTTRNRVVPSAATTYMNVARYTAGGTKGNAQEAAMHVDVLYGAATNLYAEVGVMLQAPVDLGGGRIEYPGYYARWTQGPSGANALSIVKKTGTSAANWTETLLYNGNVHNSSINRDPTILSIRATPVGAIGAQTGTQIQAWIAQEGTPARAFPNSATDTSSWFSDGYLGFGLRRDPSATYPAGETPAINAVDWPSAWTFSGGSYTATPDGGADEFYVRPYLWKWNGSTWVDTALPGPDANRVQIYGAYYNVNNIHVDTQLQVDFTFHHHDGPNANPSAIYCASYFPTNGTNPSGIQNEFIYQEYNGTSWSSQVKTHLEVFANTGGDRDLMGFLEQPLIGSNFTLTKGSAQQGMRLIWNGSRVILASAADRVLVMQLAADGTAWEPYLGKYKQPDYVHRKDYRQTNNGAASDTLGNDATHAWTDPTGVDCVCDELGRIWLIYDWFNNTTPFYGTGIFVDQDPGSGIGWMPVDGRNPLPQLDAWTFSRLAYSNNKLYVLALLDTGVNADGSSTMVIFEAPISRASYVPFVLGAVSSGAHFNIRV